MDWKKTLVTGITLFVFTLVMTIINVMAGKYLLAVLIGVCTVINVFNVLIAYNQLKKERQEGGEI